MTSVLSPKLLDSDFKDFVLTRNEVMGLLNINYRQLDTWTTAGCTTSPNGHVIRNSSQGILRLWSIQDLIMLKIVKELISTYNTKEIKQFFRENKLEQRDFEFFKKYLVVGKEKKLQFVNRSKFNILQMDFTIANTIFALDSWIENNYSSLVSTYKLSSESINLILAKVS